MNRAIAWFAANGVAANLLMATICVAGIVSAFSITLKPFPDIDVDMISVSVEYPGAAPEEVEEGVCIRIEEAIDGVEGIEEISSTAAEGACSVRAELLPEADGARALDDIKIEVDAIDTFPDEAEKPTVSQLTMQRAVIDVAVSGGADERSLRAVAQRVRDEIAALPGITQVEVALERPFEISIEVPEESLRRHGIRFDDVVQAVRRSSLDLPGGSLKTDGGEILLRSVGQAYRGRDFERIVVLTRPDGTRVTLGEIASVVDGFRDTDVRGRLDGARALLVQVSRVGSQDVLQLSNAVHHYVAGAAERLPEGISLRVWNDASEGLRGRLRTLQWNGILGFGLVLAVLALFMRFRLAFWVTLGVPISFLGGLATFGPLGLSIDVISLFAFICVLGILVDDAVVVGENVHTHQRQLRDRLQGSIAGTQEMAVPVIFGVLTTVAAFAPLLVVDAMMGDVMRVMGLVVITCLVFSLIESQLVLPAHLAHGRYRPDDEVSRVARGRPALEAVARRWQRLQGACSGGLERLARVQYRAALETALQWRYATVAIAVALLLLTAGVLRSGRMSFAFFPPIEADYLAARLTMPAGTPVGVTQRAVERIEAAAHELARDLDPRHLPPGESFVRHVLAAVGSQPFLERSDNRFPGGDGAVRRSHLGEVVIELLAPERRPISTKQLAAHWRELVGPIPDAVELVYASDLFSVGEAIHVQLRGSDVPALAAAAQRVADELATYPGVVDIADSFRAGKRELVLAMRPQAEPLGLTLSDLARQVRQAFYGEEAQRVQRGRDDVKVMVRYPEHQRRSLGDLANLRIRTPEGAEVPFDTVARAELGRGFSTIRRIDRQRVVSVTADVDRGVTNENDVLNDLLPNRMPGILADFPSVSVRLAGSQEQQRRSFAGLARAYGVALFAIYALLAVPLRSYVQPLLIMSVIPFGLVGAILGHLVLGPIKALQAGVWNPLAWSPMDLSFMSVIGIVALSGVVVNASLVLVHYVNRRRAEGASTAEAARAAGQARFRPIVLTSLTTFAGLTPLMLERSMQAQFLIPMATSLAFGVIFATGVTLFVVPSGYLILEDLRGLRRPRAAPGTRAASPPLAAPSKVA